MEFDCCCRISSRRSDRVYAKSMGDWLTYCLIKDAICLGSVYTKRFMIYFSYRGKVKSMGGFRQELCYYIMLRYMVRGEILHREVYRRLLVYERSNVVASILDFT
jgi:hypothetical protein